MPAMHAYHKDTALLLHPLVDSLTAVQALSGSGIGKVKLVPVLLEKVVLIK